MTTKDDNLIAVKVKIIYILLQFFPLIIMLALICLTWHVNRNSIELMVLLVIISPFITVEIINIYRLIIFLGHQYSDHFLMERRTGEKLFWKDILYYEKRLYGIKIFFKNNKIKFIPKCADNFADLNRLILAAKPQKRTIWLGFHV